MKLLIFDLDGTLIDSQQDLANAVNAAREHMHLPPLANETIYTYVGNGAPVLMRRAMGAEASETDVQTALEFFLTYYRAHKLDFTTLYPGVRESLDIFRSHGLSMAVLTNKPINISNDIIEGLGLAGHFFRVYGGNSFEQKKPHPIGIETLMREASAAAMETMMVGDSAVDIKTARNAGVRACGVTYGFQPETLAVEPPDLLLKDFAGLVPAVLGHS